MVARRVLVLGAGQVGCFTAERLLARGHEVVLADQRPLDPGAVANLEGVAALPLHRVDVRDGLGLVALLREVAPDALVHTAAVLPGAPARVTFEVNVQGVVNVLEAARVAGVPRVVYTSSSVVYYPMFASRYPYAGPTITEEAPIGFVPGFFYGTSKTAADGIAVDYATREGLSLAVCRLGHVWGPWGGPLGAPISFLLERIIGQALAGEPVTVTDPMLVWSGREGFVHVRNVAEALVAAAEAATLNHALYNVFDSEVHAFGDFIEALQAEVPGTKVGEIAEVSKGYAGMPVPPPFPFDITRARADLGYQGAVGLREGMAELVGWRRERG